MLALDFFTADLLNGTKVYVLAAIEHGTRRIQLHHGVQRRLPGRWRQGRPLRYSGAPNELDHGTLDRQLPP